MIEKYTLKIYIKLNLYILFFLIFYHRYKSKLMKLYKNLAAKILNCGSRKVWIDPNEQKEIKTSNSKSNIKKLIKEGFILKKSNQKHSKNHIRSKKEGKSKGRSAGTGKREGTKDSRYSQKIAWIAKQRVLRHLLKKLREINKIDRHLYRELYLKCKGNVFKNKKTLLDYIYSAKYEKKMKVLYLEKFSMRKEHKKINQEKKTNQFSEKMKKIFSDIKSDLVSGEKVKK